MALIAPLVTQAASQSLLRTLGTAAGPVGLVASVVLPVVLPRIARTLGPWGMVAAAVGTYAAARAIRRHEQRRAAAALAGPGDAEGPVIPGEVVRRKAS